MREELAATQHEIWSHWMEYLFQVSTYNEDGTVTIPAEKVARWAEQLKTPYIWLSEAERESDRDQADKVLATLIRHLRGESKPPAPFVDIIDELETHPDKGYGARFLGAIEQIVIHHVGVDANVSPYRTATYHVRTRGWPGIGYHFYVRKDGAAYQTNPLETVSYHCAGMCNARSVGICLEGSFMEGRVPGTAQLLATRAVVEWLLWRLDLVRSVVKGHREVRQTACPGSTWDEWSQAIRG